MKKKKELSDAGILVKQQVMQEIKDARKDSEMTQQELAELVGTKKSNISRLESGRYNPSLEFLIYVAECLGKELDIALR